MKTFALALLLLGSQAHASGCQPYDVGLVSETVVASLGTFKTTYQCDNETMCGVNIWNAEKNEWHSLSLLNVKGPIGYNVDLGDQEVKIYDQYFVSSCTEVHRYIIGIDFENNRYREEDDLRQL